MNTVNVKVTLWAICISVISITSVEVFDASAGTIMFIVLAIGGPVLHALIAYPKKMTGYWIFINLFFGFVGYVLFLFVLANRVKLSKINPEYNKALNEDANNENGFS